MKEQKTRKHDMMGKYIVAIHYVEPDENEDEVEVIEFYTFFTIKEIHQYVDEKVAAMKDRTFLDYEIFHRGKGEKWKLPRKKVKVKTK